MAIREVGSDTGGAPPEPALCEEDGRAAAAEVTEVGPQSDNEAAEGEPGSLPAVPHFYENGGRNLVTGLGNCWAADKVCV